jgi:ribonuclease P protein subunit POP4
MSSSSLYQSAILLEPTTTHVRLTSEHPFTPEFVQHNLRLTHSKTHTQTLYEERIRRRQLVLARKPPAVRAAKKKDRDDDARIGRREAAEKGLWRLSASEAKWELFVPLHRLWCAYVSELLASSDTAGMHAKLVKADFHGSIVTGTCVVVLVRVFVDFRVHVSAEE